MLRLIVVMHTVHAHDVGTGQVHAVAVRLPDHAGPPQGGSLLAYDVDAHPPSQLPNQARGKLSPITAMSTTQELTDAIQRPD